MSAPVTTTTTTTTEPPKQELSREQVVEHYNRLRQEQNMLLSRITEMEGEVHEHQLVVDELSKLDSSRSCHRLVGGALIERTVGEVLPELLDNTKNIRAMLDELNNMLKKKEEQIETFVSTNGLRTGPQQSQQGGAAATAKASDGKGSAAGGVLV